MWQQVENQIQAILELPYASLAEKEAPLSWKVLPDGFRCARDSVSRDVRDFLVLRHILEAASFYMKEYKAYLSIEKSAEKALNK